MKQLNTPEQIALDAQRVLAEADKQLGLVSGVLRCLVESQNTGETADKNMDLDVCRIRMDTGEVTHPQAGRAPVIWYEGEIAVRLNGEFPTFDVNQDSGKLVLTPEALAKLKHMVKKPISTTEMLETVPLDGPLGVYEGRAVKRGQEMRVLVITGNRKYIEANGMRNSAESKGWAYRACATIDADNVHLIMYKPVEALVVAEPPQVAPAATLAETQADIFEEADALAA